MFQICRVCNSNTDHIFDGKILKKYDIKYYNCSNCGFLQTEFPYWLEESYMEAICAEDTGVMLRNKALAKQVPSILYLFFNSKAKFLDYAGGYGIFVRMMRDSGFDFYWMDKYSKNILAQGFEYNGKDQIELITTFESFEHFVNPIEEIERMLLISKNILFTTELLPNPIPRPQDWWYYTLTSGQHIAFYSKKTLEFIAKKYNLFFYSNGFLHLFTEKKLGLKNSLSSKNKMTLLIAGKIKGQDLFQATSSFYKNKSIKKKIKKALKSKTMEDHLTICNNR